MNKNKEIKQDEILDDKNDLVGDEMLDKDEYIAKLNDDLNEQKRKQMNILNIWNAIWLNLITLKKNE